MPKSTRSRLPRLPALAEQKLTKTGYTRGATQREIYQNRVTRNNPVLIARELWPLCRKPDDGSEAYENGFIVLVEPSWYFVVEEPDKLLAAEGLELGVNALLLYQRRVDWANYAPANGLLPNGKPFRPGVSRRNPLGGVFLARIHATVSSDGMQVVEGYKSTAQRGAGIRVYEYASSDTIQKARLQLEALMWLCRDSAEQLVAAGMPLADVRKRKSEQLARAQEQKLLDLARLRALRIINDDDCATCPLCLAEISAGDFFKRSQQAEGRSTYDLTTTEVSLFHIQELRVGKLQHKTYNLGWGHHHCNTVAKDAGIMPTLQWMKSVMDRQPNVALADEARLVEEAVEHDR
ncbi:BstXI family restriction endonuclease [Micromonospora maris]|uniref:BstXI family restriction endonuclease n=1 Tax=Micromonospora maris TaxID=1003110 RepID=UPI000206BF61|nr:BstXI family restriction endonuclease [Micromonospora maris]AEB42265.1 hypothetical protein VAB18032_05695 [Micromonospora maris AB-18-032]